LLPSVWPAVGRAGRRVAWLDRIDGSAVARSIGIQPRDVVPRGFEIENAFAVIFAAKVYS
jgi:hypothetical protein